MDSTTLVYGAIALVAVLFLSRVLGARKAPTALVSEKLKAGARVIDVRTPPEFASGAFPKARNIPLDSLSSRLGELPKDKPLILYCASGARSASALRILKRAGFTDVLSAGGLSDMPRH